MRKDDIKKPLCNNGCSYYGVLLLKQGFVDFVRACQKVVSAPLNILKIKTILLIYKEKYIYILIPIRFEKLKIR